MMEIGSNEPEIFDPGIQGKMHDYQRGGKQDSSHGQTKPTTSEVPSGIKDGQAAYGKTYCEEVEVHEHADNTVQAYGIIEQQSAIIREKSYAPELSKCAATHNDPPKRAATHFGDPPWLVRTVSKDEPPLHVWHGQARVKDEEYVKDNETNAAKIERLCEMFENVDASSCDQEWTNQHKGFAGASIRCGPIIGNGSYGSVRQCDILKDGEICKAVNKEIVIREAASMKGEVNYLELLVPAECEHPNITALYGFSGKKEGNMGIINLTMQFGGVSLADLVHVNKGNMPLSPAEIVRCISDMCRGLAWVHKRGYIHKDVKPANVLKHQDGIYRLCDFGGACHVDKPDGGSCTCKYTAPEALRGGFNHITPAYDMYSVLGVWVFLLTQNDPWPMFTRTEHRAMLQYRIATCPNEIIADIDTNYPFYNVMCQMAAGDPQYRPTASQLLHIIEKRKDELEVRETVYLAYVDGATNPVQPHMDYTTDPALPNMEAATDHVLPNMDVVADHVLPNMENASDPVLPAFLDDMMMSEVEVCCIDQDNATSGFSSMRTETDHSFYECD